MTIGLGIIVITSLCPARAGADRGDLLAAACYATASIIDRAAWAIKSNFGGHGGAIRLFGSYAAPGVISPYDCQSRPGEGGRGGGRLLLLLLLPA